MRSEVLKVDSSSRLMRYEKVFATFIKYGFEDILSHPPFNRVLPQTTTIVPSRKGKKVSQYTRYERVRMVCEELGTTYIKFAQIASNRPDLLPEELIDELTKLQDSAPVVPLNIVKRILKNEFKRPIEDLLESFDDRPLASASMAQVHRAVLNGGREVVLKIQRPNLKSIIAKDIAILKNIVSIIESYFPKYLVYNPEELVKMFENSITEELSFSHEIANMKHFQKMFTHNSEVYVPDVYEELCTDSVICMEFIDGFKITDLEQLRKYKITGRDLALRGIGLYFEQVFEHGFFHADPHPGNIFVLKDGKIAFIDYGMMGSVIEADKIIFAKMLLAMYERDVQGLKKAILKFSPGLEREKQQELEYDVIYFLRNYTNTSIENIDGNEVMRGLNALFFEYKIKIPSKLLLLLKALLIIEGVGLKLDPDYDIIESIGPYARRLLTKRYNPTRVKRDALKSIEDNALLIKEFPEDMREILHKIKEGNLHIEIEHKGLQPLYHNFEISVNRLSYTLIIVALLVASAIVTVAQIPPVIYNVPLIGVVGLVISTVMALRLFYSIAKHGKF